MPKISIVIPVYNAACHLTETLDSVLAQTFSEWELILVDDGSTDDSAELCERFVERDARIRLVRQANGGVVVARNRGIAETDADSEFVILIDHDDLWETNALQVLHETLMARPDAVAAQGLNSYIDACGNSTTGLTGGVLGPERQGILNNRLAAWPSDAPTTFSVLAYANHILTPGQVLIRRSALRAVGPFDPVCRPADDWDIWLRLSRLGDIAFVNRVVLRYRVHEGNASRHRRAMDQAEWTVRRKMRHAAQNTAEQQHAARIGCRLKARQVCALRLKWARKNFAGREFAQAARQMRHAAVSLFRSLV